jgi:hypothetical protein
VNDDPVDEFGRQLFAAARAERLPPDLRERLTRRERSIRAPGFVSAPPPLSELARRRRPSRWLLLAALAAAVLAAGLLLLQRATHEPLPLISAERRAPDVAQRAPEPEAQAAEAAGLARDEPAAAPAPVEPRDPPPRLVEPGELRRRPAAPPVSVPGAAPVVAPGPSSNTLVEELDWLKRARVALRAGDSAQALALLQEFESKYAASELKAEAMLLQIESLAVAGRKAEASELAERFVRNAPYSPLVDRARSFIQSATGAEEPGNAHTP